MLEVVAPATLPEGYQFDVMIGSRTMSVMVVSFVNFVSILMD
jgi:hypothetical protein